MTTWYDPAVQLPEDRQSCLLMPHDDEGLTTVPVFGPIDWDAKTGAWVDLFRDPEAGTLVVPTSVGCWTPWDPIAPPEGLPTPFPKKVAA